MHFQIVDYYPGGLLDCTEIPNCKPRHIPPSTRVLFDESGPADPLPDGAPGALPLDFIQNISTIDPDDSVRLLVSAYQVGSNGTQTPEDMSLTVATYTFAPP